MILTEAEARGKWCPESRVLEWTQDHSRQDLKSTLASAAINRRGGSLGTEYRASACVGSGCMFWRWHDHVTDDGTLCTPLPTAHLARSPDKERPLTERRGYCGKAGKP